MPDVPVTTVRRQKLSGNQRQMLETLLMQYVLLGHLANARDRSVLLGQPQSVHDIDAGGSCSAVVHVVRNIVEVEKPIHEVTADAELRVRCIGIAHGREHARLQTVKRIALLLGEISAAKEPLFTFNGGLLSVAVVAQRKVAVGDEVWNEDLGGRGAQGGRGGGVGALHCVRSLGERRRDTRREKRQNEEEERALRS